MFKAGIFFNLKKTLRLCFVECVTVGGAGGRLLFSITSKVTRANSVGQLVFYANILVIYFKINGCK